VIPKLTLNVLLSFAQFERKVIGERVRDKIAASKRGGCGSAARFRPATPP
jgi:DNA invertase Pin-like site-specific DNA recombinase